MTAPPVTKPPVLNPDQLSNLADPLSRVDEEPVTNFGGESNWDPTPIEKDRKQ